MQRLTIAGKVGSLYDTLPRGTIHCTRWPVSFAIRS
jgi:hypothetical protein